MTEVFKINRLSADDSQSKPGSLVDIFSSCEAIEQPEVKSGLIHEGVSADAPSTSSAQTAADANLAEASQSVVLCSSTIVSSFCLLHLHYGHFLIQCLMNG